MIRFGKKAAAVAAFSVMASMAFTGCSGSINSDEVVATEESLTHWLFERKGAENCKKAPFGRAVAGGADAAGEPADFLRKLAVQEFDGVLARDAHERKAFDAKERRRIRKGIHD